jgi:hypothetical protein
MRKSRTFVITAILMPRNCLGFKTLWQDTTAGKQPWYFTARDARPSVRSPEGTEEEEQGER